MSRLDIGGTPVIMANISAPRGKNPGTRTDASEDGTGVPVCPGQAALVSECMWNRRPWCYASVTLSQCCMFSDEDLCTFEDDPF
jgi:hypothetical protein